MTLRHARYSILPSLFLLGAALFLGACGQQSESPAPADLQSAEERPNCPTCGMYADMTPEWQATIEYKDGSVLYFDVPEHMLDFYIDPARHEATDTQKNLDNVARITVTDYQSKSPIDSRQAFYVVGSDLKSPMGEGVVAFQSKGSADQFLQEHEGRVLTFPELTPEVVAEIQ